MTWFKVDDSFYDHPKVFDAPDAAVALWTRAGTWSARNLTDGFVPAGLPARLCDDHETAVRELVRRGLWRRTNGGYQFHDWREYQPTADDVRNLRAKRAEAGRRGGLARAKQNASKRQASVSGVAKQNAAPTRPDPSRPDGPTDHQKPPPVAPSESSPPSSDGRRGTRLPEEFAITDAMKAWARENAPLAGITDHEMFIDHWRAQTGQRAVKRDWEATWRNWMRRVQENRSRIRPAAGPARSTTDERVAQALDAGARLQAIHDQQQRRELA
ncbi:hypothetical protein [Rhizomonospora bruguierae]|uniref:hypothetical protein n=1 Tax=Rhizomonospora bruguierae TaxID=1581705 RepID=UPI001BD032D4|nr:hypothetical protein [Micromonospora sp. NBRC 107566]